MARPLLLFYILVVYVVLQFSWWAYMIIDLNTEIIRTRLEVITLLAPDEVATREQTAAYNDILQKKIRMVYGEGFVFLGLLIFGFYKIRQAFRTEFRLARQQKNFLLSITHEFKSPLAAVKLNLQTLQRRKLDQEQEQRLLSSSLQETERIHELVENVLLAARLESTKQPFQLEPLRFDESIQDTIRSFREHAGQTTELNAAIQPNVMIKGDRLALNSLVLNLLENAAKYAPGSPIDLVLTQTGTEALLSVSDFGKGIPESERQRIFNKFYRIGNEDTRMTKGTGLGLFNVRQIALLHKGTVSVKNNRPQGSVFEVRLPLCD
jgi:signal transduction histidine kinase